MKLKSIILLLLPGAFFFSCSSKSDIQDKSKEGGQEIEFIEQDSEKRVDVMIGGDIFTSYRWHDAIFLNIKKPVLYPVMTSAGTEITRGYPLNPRAGERVDHLHHVGVCFNYGDVNGIDFWGNSAEIPENKRGKFGTIKHNSIEKLKGGLGEGLMVTSESWIDPSGKELLSEKTEYHFIAIGPARIIDRITTLNAKETDVSMKDTKEGLYGIRVARQLELPSQDELILTDAQGNPTTVKKMGNEGVSGNYRSSEGFSGDEVYGTRAIWVKLYGNIGNEKVSLVMIDHPQNVGYPTYWHARGYGLLLANPLGAGSYSNGENLMNFVIPAGKSETFRFRMIIHSGSDLTDSEINAYSKEFAEMY